MPYNDLSEFKFANDQDGGDNFNAVAGQRRVLCLTSIIHAA